MSYMHKLLSLFAALMLAVFSPAVRAQSWTTFTPEQTFYVSTSGSDSNPGTQAQPFLSISRGLTGLRDGHADALLLKAGDTWVLQDQITLTKSAHSTTQYMLLGSYGAGPRPKIRTPSHGIYGGNTSQQNGFAIVGLDLAPISMTTGSDGIVLLSTAGHAWDDVLIEDCYISGYSAGIVAQTLVDGHAFYRMKIRNSIVVDNDNNGGGHAQGIFLGGARDWLIEGCLLDNNARSKADMFCHNLYVHEWSGPGVFRGNISSRACSHGGQQRPGGLAEDNLFLGSPINFYMGGESLQTGPTVNTFRRNVCIDSRNINPIDRRGLGYVLAGAPGSLIDSNIAAHQRGGTDNVTAVDLDGFSGSLRGNLVYDWTYNGASWGVAFQWEPNTAVSLFSDNRAYMPTGGYCVSGASGSFDHNRYWSINPGPFNGQSWSLWATRETASVFQNPGARDVTPEAFMGTPTGLLDFITAARGQSKSHWDTRFTSAFYNTWARARMGLGCRADLDDNGVLNANDFQAMLTRFAMGDPSADFDDNLQLNANDFQAFLNAFAVGCN